MALMPNVEPNRKNVCYIWVHLLLKLRDRNIELCAVPILLRFCHSRLHLYSVQVPFSVVDDENVVSYIYFWNGCIPTPKKKLCHNG